MPAATLRKPDFTEIPPPGGLSRAERLQNLMQQDFAGSAGDRVSLIAWRADTKRWVVWFDQPAPPDPNAKKDVLVEAGVAIAS